MGQKKGTGTVMLQQCCCFSGTGTAAALSEEAEMKGSIVPMLAHTCVGEGGKALVSGYDAGCKEQSPGLKAFNRC